MSDEKPASRWVEHIGDSLYELEGDPLNGAERRVVSIHSLTSLTKRQKVAKIPPTYRAALLATWKKDQANAGAREAIESYLAMPDKSLYVHGRVGRGKTFLACCIANEFLSSGKSVRFQTLSDLLLRLRDTFSAEERSELGVLFPLFEVGYLILDELGDVTLEKDRRASEFAALRLLTLLDKRWQEGRPTIMTSNLPLDELVRWSGDERIGSRIFGMCGEGGVIELAGRDLRFDLEEVLAAKE